jgi:phytoene synthase
VSDGALTSYVDKWLAIQPQQRLALPFVSVPDRSGYVALAALEQELIAAAYGIREPQVALAKLGWWAEELSGAAASGGRHPLTKALFADARARTVPADRWTAPVLAAMEQFDEGTAAHFAGQLDAAAPMHGALAALETAWWFGPGAAFARASRIATLSHLLYALSRLEEDVERERLPLPMANLARFGLSRDQLRGDSPARGEALRAQLDDIVDGFASALAMDEPLSVFRGLEARTGLMIARRARRAAEPLRAIHAGQSRTGLATTFRAWHAAREWRRRIG